MRNKMIFSGHSHETLDHCLPTSIDSTRVDGSEPQMSNWPRKEVPNKFQWGDFWKLLYQSSVKDLRLREVLVQDRVIFKVSPWWWFLCWLVYCYLNKNHCPISSDNVSDQKTYVKLDTKTVIVFSPAQKSHRGSIETKTNFTNYKRKLRWKFSRCKIRRWQKRKTFSSKHFSIFPQNYSVFGFGLTN